MNSQNDKLGVIHSVNLWGMQTTTWLYTQVKFLPPMIDNRIICITKENLEQFFLPHIYQLDESSPVWRFFNQHSYRIQRWRRSRLLMEQARAVSARILHSHFGDRGWNDMIDAKQAGLKHVVTFYGFDFNYLIRTYPVWRVRYRELFAKADLILCEGPHFRRCIVDAGCPEHKVQVQHLGVMLDQIPFRPRVWDANEPLRVLISGTFTEKKGIPYALEALAKIQHRVPLQITLIGDANRQEEKQREKAKILATIEKNGLQDQVRMLGFQPYAVLLEEAYKHHIFLSPSVTSIEGDTEGGAPVTIIEMAASGMPVVSTTHCDIPEVIQNGFTGLLASERDVDGLVVHLNWLIDNPHRWEGMVTAGRRHIEAEFDASTQGRRLADLYRALVDV